MWPLLLLAICSPLILNIKPSNCGAVCPDNEVFVEEPDPCNTCEHLLGDASCSAEECNHPGCDCKPGYYRNRKGHCVTKEECQEDFESNECDCTEDEEYLECSCERTCRNRGNCSSEGVSGCFCKEPLVRNYDGECVRLEDCDPEKCRKDEVFKECGSACPPTCDDQNKSKMCTMQCVKGCFCRDGLVRNKNGDCVKRSECSPGEPDKCGKHEVFKECGSACPPTCEDKNKSKMCTRQCVRGCFCRDGLVRNKNGDCVKRSECSPGEPEKCGKHEVFKECGSACPPTCEDKNKSKTCTRQCVRGCFCRDGLVRNKNGDCVKRSECSPGEPEKCGKHEVFKECGSACPPTCEDKNKSKTCTRQCVRGCFCRDGLVRNKNGDCVKRSECSPGEPEKCGKHEVFKECGSACPPTCEDKNKSKMCTMQCVRGCFCRDGLVRNKNGDCVKRSECSPGEPEKCGKHEVFKECGSACPPTCEDKNKSKMCTMQCVRGCFCRDGLVRNKNGDCVKRSECSPGEPEKCGKHEVFKECGSACPPTCEDKNKSKTCTRQCVRGCFCRDGLVRNKNGDCVKRSECSPGEPEKCGKHEVFKECGSACPPTCEEKNKSKMCTMQCVRGCFCRDGLVRNKNGDCVKRSECSPGEPEKCGKHEVFKECGSACPPTCEDKNKSKTCTRQCVRGCFCRDGLVRNKNGDCVKRSECSPGEPEKCGKHEVFKECGSACPPTCEDKNKSKMCTMQCVRGCFCRDGLVRNKNGDCVKRSECSPGEPEKCGKHEVFKECGSACPPTCEDKNKSKMCTRQCVRGCFCRDGLVRNKNGDCVKRSECSPGEPEKCGKHEVFKECGSACPPTCEDKNKSKMCTRQCVRGCFCRDGLVRNKNGDCVKRSECSPGEPEKCGKHEVFKECGSACPPTCEDKNKSKMCTMQCVRGCFCRDGLVRNKNGDCVKRSECSPGEPEKCGKHEVFKECGSACPPTCEDKNKSKMCTMQCVRGCFCRDGLVRNKNGDCVKRSECSPGEPGTCPKNESYDECGSACPPTCENQGKPGICTYQCVPGCFCNKGLVRNSVGKCVKLKECLPPKICPKNESYKECGSACPPTCKNLGKPRVCTKQCISGCFCNKGLVRNDDGICVKPKKCPAPPTCPKNESYDECGSACPPTCENQGQPEICTYECVPGCFCNKGLVRNSVEKCVKLKECLSPGTCPKNESYKECGSACPPTCKNLGKPRVCTKQCVSGCFCNKGLVRNDDGICVKPKKCPPPLTCPKNESYDECGSACPPTCENQEQPEICTYECVPGCFCNKGLVRNSVGKCVKLKECSTPGTCPKNENYKECGSACPPTCKNLGKPRVCTKQCVPGCFCNKGFVRNDDGICVKPKDCSVPQTCPKNESYEECGSACPPTCKNWGKPQVCTKQCVSGCFCNKGFVRNDEGVCVKPRQCPPTEICPENESYKECGSACPPTCANHDKPRYCTLQCVSGCFCNHGLVRNDEGVCVNPKQCSPSENCPKNESYEECGTACPATCKNRGKPQVCTKQCVSGCFCNKGLLRNDEGVCVKPRKCPPSESCPENENYNDCGNPCEPTCSQPDKPLYCKMKCRPGCFCNEGFVRNDDGLCVRPKHCSPTQTCPKNESYEECGTACPPTCKNRGKPQICTMQCVSGCFCNKGLVRNDEGVCIKPRLCPPSESCPENENYSDCGNPCAPTCSQPDKPLYCKMKCQPGCFCNEGFVRNDDGICVQPEQCSPTQTCPKNESYEECGSACPPTCKNKGKPQICTTQCVSGCFCNKGLVRNDEGVCIKPRLCPPSEICPENESYEECGSACPPTCANHDKPRYCTLQCVSGCFCNKGLVRNDEGVCVNPKQCSPSESCPENESYSDCGNPCAATCSQPDKPLYCKMKCQPGCFCNEGYVRNDDGICVQPEECSQTQCDINEEIVKCVKPKWCNTCEIKGLCKIISDSCRKGCDCKKGYYRNKSGKCIPESQCPVECPRHEQHVDCVKPCNDCKLKGGCDIFPCKEGCDCIEGYFRDETGICIPEDFCPIEQCDMNEEIMECVKPKWCNTCEIKGRCKIISDICKKGCDCKTGYYRNKSGKCVPESQCPVECPRNEQYVDCVKPCNDCKLKGTCDIFTCKKGCDCVEGYFRDETGVCIPADSCPIEQCGKNEVIVDCAKPKWCNTCEIKGNCKLSESSCKKGCDCKKGYYRNKSGICIPESHCTECGKNEEIVDCVKPKWCNTCEIKGNCKLSESSCKKGCDCKDGYYRNKSGICIPESQCNKCGKNEEIVDCVKPKWCNTCEIKGNCKLSESSCKKGCDCKDGYYRNKSGICIPESQCNGSCPPNEEHSFCVNPCNDCEIRGRCEFIACNEGCDCIEGYHRDEDGICIPEDKCPQNPICGEDEVYDSCGTACPPTCENQGRPEVCTEQCVKGCFCRDDLVRDRNGKCVKRDQCQQGSCPPNEKHSLCVIPCNTCEIRGKCQFLVCNEGCDCLQGYFRNEYGICIPKKKCPHKPICGENEEYQTCGTACPATCKNRGLKIRCIDKCVEGCFCKKGFVRNSYGLCVNPKQCPPVSCPTNERYSNCVNPCNDCQIRGKCNFLICNKGCDCISGYHRNSSGKCIPANNCPVNTPTCGVNEVYNECGTACPATCSRSNPQGCTEQCVKGCFCKDGFVRNNRGECIEPEKCPQVSCPTNERYSNCVNPCNDCQIRGKCNFLICNKGCDCISGYHRNSSGKCIPANTCPVNTPTCGVNEVYNECGTACPATCSRSNPQGCTEQCVKGCFCKDGFVRNNRGECIEPEKCPQVSCPKNERYSDCVNPCNDCQIRGKCNFLICNKGCDCIKGYHRDNNGKCIPANTCPVNPPTCGVNEVYNECGTACPATCSRNNPQGCTEQCVKGCFCKDGFVRNNRGECVEPEKCPQECGHNEEIVKCAKPKTCNTCEIRGNCSLKRCIEGCDCISGFYRNKSGICIPVSQCPKSCGKDEVYEECGTACPDTCSNLGRNRVCTLQCVPGCFCRNGLVRNESNKCVKPEECPRGTCGANEIYEECGTACPPTCSNLGQNQACTLQCVPGCFCRDDLIRNEFNQCVRPEECRSEPVKTCGLGEEYYDCVPTCKDTCENYNDEHPICPRICRRGCACRKGLVKRKDGKCVLPELCETRTCGINEEYLKCGSACPPNCSTIGKSQVCATHCVPGCFCCEGFVRNESNECVKIDQCPQVPPEKCPKNQKYYKCIPSCRRTCMTYNSIEAYCKKDCVPGCFCKDHLVMNKYGECVKPEECPGKGCGLMEQYYKCMPDCENRCNPPDACTAVCRPGCFCRPGLVLRGDGKCVRKQFCDMEEPPKCDHDQQFYDCIPTCGTTCKTYKKEGGICHGLCRPGCFCKPGLVLNEENVCVPPEQCPEIGTCGDNEVYKECGTACPVTCSSQRASNTACTLQCVPGCFCRDGFVRNELNECVRPEECPPECPINQKYYECIPDCGNICETYGKENVASIHICRNGCFCKSGYVMNNQNACVGPEECPTSKECGLKEQYYNCMPDCYNRCNPPDACAAVCRAGCFCKEGLVLNDYGECVEKELCGNDSSQQCDIDQQYYKCIPDCGNTCQTYFNKSVILCPAICKPGCFCKPGLVMNDDNICVLPEQCPKPICRETEQYYDCIPYCKNTCNTYGKNIACKMPCTSGCFCKPGLVLNDENLCVPPEQCPNDGTCGDNEVYNECGTACPVTCSSLRASNPACTSQCVKGCFCRDGFVRNEFNECVKPEECPLGTCGWNEQYYNCMPDCFNRCNPPDACAAVCRAGCFCKEGLVLNDDGECVEKELCGNDSSQQCDIDQQYYKCIPDCGNTCQTYFNKSVILCPAICKPGCFCKPGLVMNDHNICVLPKQCPKPTCRETEQYYDCIPDCTNTCDTYQKNIACKKVCRPGCFCKPGLVLNDENLCVNPDLCPNAGICPDDTEQYYECTPSCKNNCKNYNNPGIRCGCGPPGCYCKQGLVKRESDSRCVLPKECDQETQVCGPNEKYYGCIPTCNNTCEDYNKILVCPKYCLSGCDCKERFVRRRDGKCVRPHQCEKELGSTETSQSSSTSTSSSTWSEGYQKESGEQIYQTNTGSSVWIGKYKEDNERESQSESKSSAWSGVYQDGGSNSLSNSKSSTWSGGCQTDVERDSQSNSKSSAWSGVYQTDEERGSHSDSKSSAWSGAYKTDEERGSHSDSKSSAWSGAYKTDEERGSLSDSKSSAWSGAYQTGEAYNSQSNHKSSSWAGEYEKESDQQSEWSRQKSSASSAVYEKDGEHVSQSNSKSAAWVQEYQEENGQEVSQSNSGSYASSNVYQEGGETSQSSSKSAAWSEGYQKESGSQYSQSSSRSSSSGVYQEGNGKQISQSGWSESSQIEGKDNQDHESNHKSTWSEFYDEDDSSSSEEDSDNWMEDSYDGFSRNDVSPDDITGTKYDTDDSFWDSENTESAENSHSENEKEIEFQRFSDYPME